MTCALARRIHTPIRYAGTGRVRRWGIGTRAAAMVILTSLAALVTAIAATLAVAPSTLGIFFLPVTPPSPVVATVDIKPESLQKRSQGASVVAFIELPTGFDVAQIALATVRVCLGTDPCGTGGVPATNPKVGDADADGIPDLKVQFDRALVIALVANIPAPAVVTFTVSGFVGASIFVGSDTVRLVDPTPEGATSSPPPEPTVGPSPTPEGASSSPPPEPTVGPSPTPSPSPSGPL